jgi:energy-coupling factor transport system permease protein
MHRLWIGTKLIGLLVLTVATALNTGWMQLAGLAVVTGVALVAARVPRRAIPRLPAWFWLTIAIGFALSAIGSGGPGQFVRFTCFMMVFLLLTLVIAWTTELGELAPALSSMGAPLRRLGAPVDEWALAAALSVRCLPLMLDECRIVLAARSQRPHGHRPVEVGRVLVDVVTASMAAAVRRAADLGEVIALRGGPPPLPRTAVRIGGGDAVALALVLAASVVPSLAG